MNSPASNPQEALKWLLSKGYGKANPAGWVRIVAAPAPCPAPIPLGKRTRAPTKPRTKEAILLSQDLQTFVAVIRCLSGDQVECSQGRTKDDLLFRLRPPKKTDIDPLAREADRYIQDQSWKRDENDNLTWGGDVMVEWWEGEIAEKEIMGYRARGVEGLFYTEHEAVLAYRDAP